MTRIIWTVLPGLFCFGAACFGGMYRYRKKYGAGNMPARLRWGMIGGALFFYGACLLGCFAFPADGMIRQAEQVCALSAVLYCAVTDAAERIIPNAAVLALSIGICGFCTAEILCGEDGGEVFWRDRLFGFGLALAILGISALLLRGGVGGGDIKLLSLLGFSYGLSGIVTLLFFSFLPCALFSAVLLTTGKGKKDTTLPLGPFLAFGTVLTTVLLWI